MATFLIMAFISILSIGITASNNDENLQASKDLQNDAQDFNHNEAELDRQWQEDMYNQYYSPEAMFQQYRNTGLSSNAAAMAASGISGFNGSGASATSGIANNPLSGNNGMSQLMEAITNNIRSSHLNELTDSQKEGQDLSNQWLPTMNAANVHQLENDIWYKRNMFGLSEREFNEVTKPVAQSTIDLNTSEIDKNIQILNNLYQDYLNAKETFHKIQSETRLNNANAERVDTLIPLEAQQMEAQTTKIKSETESINIENDINRISRNLSQVVGFDVHLDWQNGMIYKNLETGINAGTKVEDWFRIAKQTLRASKTPLKIKGLAYSSFGKAKDYVSKWYKGETDWQRREAASLKELEDWINHNTRYGM